MNAEAYLEHSENKKEIDELWLVEAANDGIRGKVDSILYRLPSWERTTNKEDSLAEWTEYLWLWSTEVTSPEQYKEYIAKGNEEEK